MQKRSKQRKDQERLNNANIFNEGFQMGFAQGKKVGEADAMRKLQNNEHSETTRPTPKLSDMSEL